MTDADLHTLGPQLTAYLRRFHFCFGQQRTTDHLHTYCRGLLSDLPRKSVEPLALAAGTPVRTLQEFLRVAFRRARVEHCFRVCKAELGFSHFEGRNYGALLRHLNLCLLTLNFVAEHTERLRGEKSGGDSGAGVPGVGDVMPRLAASASGDERDGERATGHPLPPRAQSRGSQGPTQKAGHRSYSQKASTPPPQATKPINEFFQVALYC